MPSQVFQLFPVCPDTPDGKVPVHCDRVMDCCNGGNPPFDGPDTVRQALVIMDDVIMMELISQIVIRTETEGEHFREPHGGNRDPFQQVDGVGQLFQRRDPKRVLGVVQIETWQCDQGDVRVNQGIRGSRKNIHPVSQIFKGS